MNWVFLLVVAWFAVSVTVAVLFGRVIRTRDEREVPRTETTRSLCLAGDNVPIEHRYTREPVCDP
ncbi:hypothetical protein D1O33_24490 (plasmid) [Rhodococcus rhodochrous]|nr:hypothetical protein D1O33_24490 [Rhodococcus rhodochrous]